MIDFTVLDNPNPVQNRCVVRLKTSTWSDNKGLHIKRDLTYLRRKCVGFNLLEEDISHIGADYVSTRIINMDECKDGVYEIVTCNERMDWETGYIDDHDYKLIEYKDLETV